MEIVATKCKFRCGLNLLGNLAQVNNYTVVSRPADLGLIRLLTSSFSADMLVVSHSFGVGLGMQSCH